ncbi:hypothetical protein V8D89_009855 [Ganoderma adspersum]
MRIPTITLALLAAALSGSAGARLTKASKATAPGPAFLAARDYAAGHSADLQKRQVPDVAIPAAAPVPATPPLPAAVPAPPPVPAPPTGDNSGAA